MTVAPRRAWRSNGRPLLLEFHDWEPHILDRVKLKHLNGNHCHWPYGDPFDGTLAFCGREVHKNSYCLEHYKRAYQPTNRKE